MVTRRRQQLAAATGMLIALLVLGGAIWFADSNHSATVPTTTSGTYTTPGVVTIPSTQIQHTGSSYQTDDFNVTLPAGATSVKEETGSVNQVEFSDGTMQARVRSQPLPAGQTLENVAAVYGLPSQAKRFEVGGHKGYLYTFKSGSQVSQIVVAGRGQTVYFLQIVSPTSRQAQATQILKQLAAKATLK